MRRERLKRSLMGRSFMGRGFVKKNPGKQEGNVTDLISTGFCILAMCVILLYFFDFVDVIGQKHEVSQLARKYILKMETVGYLEAGDLQALLGELKELGVEEVNLEGTTFSPVTYGQPVALMLEGTLKGGRTFHEKRVSTSKN